LPLSEPFVRIKPNEYGKRVAKQASTGGGQAIAEVRGQIAEVKISKSEQYTVPHELFSSAI
jgi:hypothetical protein